MPGRLQASQVLDSTPFILFILFLVGLIVQCRRHSRSRRPISREARIEQQRRQRHLIAMARLRANGMHPVVPIQSQDFQSELIEMDPEATEKKRNRLLKWFADNGLQLKVKKDDFVDQDSMAMNNNKDETVKANYVLIKRTQVVPCDQTVVSQCVICVDSYSEGETIVWSNNKDCIHCFHQDCALDYLVYLHDLQGTPCPVCRQPFIIPDNPPKPSV